MVELVAWAIVVAGLFLAAIDFFDLRKAVERKLQNGEKKISSYMNFVTHQKPVPKSQTRSFKRVIKKIGPYEIGLLVAIFIALFAYYMLTFFRAAPLAADLGWGGAVFSVVIIVLIGAVSAFLIAVPVTVAAIAGFCIIGALALGALSTIFELLSFPRKGIVTAFGAIVAVAALCLEFFRR